MELKYTAKAIEEALEPWEYAKENENPLQSIFSRLHEPHSRTTIWLNKAHPLYGFPLFPSHVYTIVDGRVWHPGAATKPIFRLQEENIGYIKSIEELCHPCTYKKLLKLFEQDKNFNILINNCQIIMGNLIETFLLWISYINLLLFAFFGNVWLGLSGLFIIVCVLISEKLSYNKNILKYSACPHVKSIIIKIWT